jgi:hypothetical protein
MSSRLFLNSEKSSEKLVEVGVDGRSGRQTSTCWELAAAKSTDVHGQSVKWGVFAPADVQAGSTLAFDRPLIVPVIQAVKSVTSCVFLPGLEKVEAPRCGAPSSL